MSREFFSSSENSPVYQSVIQDFKDTVVKGSSQMITPQSVDAYLGQQGTLTSDQKKELRPLLLQLYGVKDVPAELKESSQIQFQPDGTALQPSMGAAEPIGQNSLPGGYLTSDPEPVLPDTKKAPQRQTLNRGGSGEAEAYTWDLAAYQQGDVAGQYPSRGIPPVTLPTKNLQTGMSSMAGTTTITNEIYGPRVPKERGPPPKHLPDTLGLNATELYPSVYGPSTRPLPVVTQTGIGDLTGQDTLPPTTFQIPSLPKIDPVPYLPDFSRFQK